MSRRKKVNSGYKNTPERNGRGKIESEQHKNSGDKNNTYKLCLILRNMVICFLVLNSFFFIFLFNYKTRKHKHNNAF